MAIQKKNLLEAFQASAAAEKAPSAPAPRASSKAGGPFAAASPPAPAALETPRRERWKPDQLQRLVALFVVVSVAAFFLGRASVSSVGAQDAPASAGPAAGEEAARAALAPPGTSPAAAPSQPEPASAATKAATPAERALLDPRNRYTVKLVEYRSGRDDELALETLRYLQGLGLPAVAQFRGKQLFILLGAAASTGELDDLLARARTLTGPPPLSKKNEFHDAYVVVIDKLIQR